MSPSVAELLEALPESAQRTEAEESEMRSLLADLAERKVPVGSLHRFWLLGTLQAKIGLAYLAWWMRGTFSCSEKRQRDLNETHLRTAMKLLGTMGYMRGTVMKLGQLFANYPEIAPTQFSEVLSVLQFDAPRMHFSLLREHFQNELGKSPEELFDEFETEAFAAASLGQVHRAKLKGSGKQVAIKIQYPDIARTIRDDFRGLATVLAPMRLSRDWDNILDQLNEIVRTLELETDYEKEAEFLRRARLVFGEDENVVVPHVYPDLCTKRILTMDYLDGVHIDDFLESNPSQEARDRYGELVLLANMRIEYALKTIYADPHPGNYVFLPNGKLGLIDFGCCREIKDDEIRYVQLAHQACPGEDPELLRTLMIRGGLLTPAQQADEKRLELMMEFGRWLWLPIREGGAFDFGDEAHIRKGIELFAEMTRRRYTRSMPLNTWLNRQFLGVRVLMHRLRARVRFNDIYVRERANGGWC